MTKVLIIILLAMSACVALISGCAASGEQFVRTNSPTGKAVIYIYRKPRAVGAANTIELFANGENITRMTNGGYYAYVADPGPVEFKGLQDVTPVFIALHVAGKYLDGQRPMYSFDALPDQEYFLEFNIVGLKMKPVSSQKALDNLKNLRMFEDKRSKAPAEIMPTAAGVSSK